MVKKNLVNKNVIRALSIGLSVAMASQPMIAMAAEEGNPIDKPETWYPDYADFEAADFAQGAASASWDATERADKSIENLVDAAEELKEEIGETAAAAIDELKPQVQEKEEPVLIADDAATDDNRLSAVVVDADAEENNIVAVIPIEEEEPEKVATDECDRAEGFIEEANKELETAEEADKDKVAYAKEAGGYVKEIVSEVSAANETISQAKEDAVSLVETATTGDETAAKKAVADLREVVGQAETAYNTAATNVATLEDEYETAKANLTEASRVYNQSLKDAQLDRHDAKEELKAAEAKLNDVETALKQAQADFQEANKNALEVLSAWEDVEKVFANRKDVTIVTTREGREDTYLAKGRTNQNQSTDEWRAQDALFEAIFKNYADENLLGEGVLAKSVSRYEGVDGKEYNYFAVKCDVTVDGETKEVTKYYDFKQMSGDNKEIYIYEVSEDEVNANAAVKAYLNKTHKDYASVNKDDIRVYKYVDNDGKTKYMLNADMKRKIANGEIVSTTDAEGNSTYWIKNHHTGEPEILITNVDAKLKNVGEDNKVTDVKIKESSKKDVWRVDEDGNLIKVKTADVTYTEYEKKSADSGTTYYDSDNEAKRAMNDAINALKSQLTIAEANGDTKKVDLYRKVIEYIPTWTASIDPVKNLERGYVMFGSLDEKGKQALREYIDKIKDELDDQGYKLDSDSLSYKHDSDNNVNLLGEPYRISGSLTALKKNAQTKKAYGDKVANEDDVTDPIIVNNENGFRALGDEDSFLGFFEEYYYVNVTSRGYKTQNSYTETVDGYSYAFDYLQKLSERTEKGEDIKVTEYENAVKILNEIIQNANKNTHLLETSNEEFKNFINAAKTTRDNFANLLDKVEKAQRDVKTAEANVEGLKVQIWLLQQKNDKVDTYKADLARLIVDYTRENAAQNGGNGFVNMFELANYDVQELEDILDDILNDAKNKLKDLKQDVENLKTDLKKADDSLSRFNPTGGGETTEGGGADTDEDTAAPAGFVAPEAPVVAPGVAVGGVAIGGGAPAAPGTGEGEGLTNITQQAATSASVPEDKAVETTDIQTQAAKAAAPISEETMSWWWLLIIAVLGGAGYAMYKKFQAKKEENKTN